MGIGRLHIYKGPFLSLSTAAPDDDFPLFAVLFILANHEIDFAQLAQPKWHRSDQRQFGF